MSDLRRTFVAGRMNKDLDERLVPEGEYRDAMNIEVSTSENSYVGAVQSVMGNTPVSKNFIAQNLNMGLNLSPNAVCVGEIVDEKNDKLYWFVSDSHSPAWLDKKDMIVEFDNKQNTVLPVVVDLHVNTIPMAPWFISNPRVLNFNPNFPITGINIIFHSNKSCNVIP